MKQKEDERKKAIHMEEQRKAWERDRVLSNKDDPYGDPFADKYDISIYLFICPICSIDILLLISRFISSPFCIFGIGELPHVSMYRA